MDVKTLKGIAVVNIAGSQKIGSVGDVIVDSQERRIAAFRVESGGLLRKEKQYLPFEAVRSVGSDAIMVEDDTVLHERFGQRSTGYHTLDKLTGLRVVTDSGTYVGNVATVHFDPKNGRVTEWEVSPGGLSGMLKSNKLIESRGIINIGEDIMVIPAAAVGEEEPARSANRTA